MGSLSDDLLKLHAQCAVSVKKRLKNVFFLLKVEFMPRDDAEHILLERFIL
jgi:hypothetical protein